MASLWQSVKRWLGLRPAREDSVAERLYLLAVAEARQPDWYRHGGVSDTLDGRFEMLLLHLSGLQERLERLPDRSFALMVQRALSEFFFRDMDRSLREIGISDTGVGKRIRAMAEAYFGRLLSYRQARAALSGTPADTPAAEGTAGDGGTLWRATLQRNVYGRTFSGRMIPPALRARLEASAPASVSIPDAERQEAPLSWLIVHVEQWFRRLDQMPDELLLGSEGDARGESAAVLQGGA